MILHLSLIKSKANINLQRRILLIGIFLLIIKFSAYFLTSSTTILSDAFESIINVTAAAFALFSLSYSARPRDKNHPYGHGKVEFLSSGMEGVLILIAGLGIIYKSVYSFIFPGVIENLDWGIALIAFAGIINYIMGFILEKKGKEQNAIVLEAGGKHLKTDAYSTLVLLLGLFAIYLLKMPVLDSVFAFGFGVYIGIEGYRIIRKSVAGIMDEADFGLLGDIIEVLNKRREERWIDFHNLRVIKYGSVIHIDVHMTIPYYLSIQEGHKELDKVEQLIRQHFGNAVELFVHIDPCVEQSCPLCPIQYCKVRKHAFIHRLEWNLDTVLENQKHEADMLTDEHSGQS